MGQVDGDRMRIGTLAEEFGLNPKTLRYYEDLGILQEPPRSLGGQRRYDDRHRERLRFIRRAKAVGFTLEEVRDVVSLAERDEPPCPRVQRLVEEKLQLVERRMRELEGVRDRLQRLQEGEPSGEPDADAPCSLLGSVEDPPRGRNPGEVLSATGWRSR